MKPQLEIIKPNMQYLSGFADAKLKEAETLDTVACSLVPNFNVERFEAIAIRVYLGKEFNVTIFALDKSKMHSGNSNGKKLPVKKYKVQLSLEEFLSCFSNINFTMSTGDFDLEDIEVINK